MCKIVYKRSLPAEPSSANPKIDIPEQAPPYHALQAPSIDMRINPLWRVAPSHLSTPSLRLAKYQQPEKSPSNFDVFDVELIPQQAQPQNGAATAITDRIAEIYLSDDEIILLYSHFIIKLSFNHATFRQILQKLLHAYLKHLERRTYNSDAA